MLRTVLALMAVSIGTRAVAGAPDAGAVRPSHVVIAIMENRSYSRIIGNPAAPYINSLARRGALLTQSFAVTHPSQPNYLALFSGSTHEVISNACPLQLSGENLASALLRAGHSFAIYSESMPLPGYTGCEAGRYRRKHNPAANWQRDGPQRRADGGPSGNLPAGVNLPFSAFPRDFSKLPSVSMVVPDQGNDMHDGREPETIQRGDAWLKHNLDAYVQWAQRNNGLFILTWDEDDGSEGNRIVTIISGAMVRAGIYGQRVDHYAILRMVLALFGLAPIGHSASAPVVDGIWHTPSAVGNGRTGRQ